MSTFPSRLALAFSIILMLPSCGTEEITQAELSVYMDVSEYSVLTSSKPLRGEAITFVQRQAETLMSGDRLNFSLIGTNELRIAEQRRQVETDHLRQMPDAIIEIEAIIMEMTDPFFGDEGEDKTNILASVQSFPPNCASERSIVIIITDGLENGDEYSAQNAIARNLEIDLPVPSEEFLRGCNIVLWGAGMSSRNPRTDTNEMLTPAQIAALKKAWEAWFVAAGARSVSFASRRAISAADRY